MINFETKTITLGYGDVAIGSNIFGVTLQNIRPPQECGKVIYESDNVEFFDEKVIIRMTSIEDCTKFKELLNDVSETGSFTINEWTIEFIPGSDVSIEVVQSHVMRVYYYFLSLLAC
jgi:hypothetical protein